MTNVTIFDRAVSAHALWKVRLRQAIETGKSEWTVANVEADDRSDFGDWRENLPLPRRRPIAIHLYDFSGRYFRN